MKSKTPNARFWILFNGDYVKVTLRPGQEIGYRRAKRMDEGFAWFAQSYRYTEDNEIESHHRVAGQDCDGAHEQSWDLIVRVDELPGKADRDTLPMVDDNDETIAIPKWQVSNYTNYDQFAQRAGY